MFMPIEIRGLCAGMLKFRLILNVVPTYMRMLKLFLGNDELKSRILASGEKENGFAMNIMISLVFNHGTW